MTCFEKSPLRLKTQTLRRKYDAFTVSKTPKQNGAFDFDLVNNCDVTGGSARVGVGVESLTLANGRGVIYDWSLSSPQTFLYCGDHFAVLSEENKLYFYDLTTRKFLLHYDFGGKMKCVEAQDATGAYDLYFCGEAGLFIYDKTNGVTRVSALACLPVGCVFQGRIFTASNDAIVYGAPFSKGDFEESIDDGGKIVLPSETGEVVDMAATSEAVYVFCSYGIWKLTISGSARDFSLEKVGFTGVKILKGSACPVACSKGEKVFFFTQYGIQSLDKSGVKSICQNLTFPIKRTGQVCEHAYLDGKVVYNYRAKDNSVRNVVIDVETEQGYHSFTAEGLSDIRGQAVGVVDSIVYMIESGRGLPIHRPAEMIAENCDFGVSGLKTLRKLRVFGEGQITLDVSVGGRSKTFDLSLENGVAEADVKLRGEHFRLCFTLSDHTRLRVLETEICALSGLK